MTHEENTARIANKITAAGIASTMEEITKPFEFVLDLFPVLRRAGLPDETILQVFISEARHRGLSAEVANLRPVLRSLAQ